MSIQRPLDLNEPVWFLIRGVVFEGKVYQVLPRMSRVHYNVEYPSPVGPNYDRLDGVDPYGIVQIFRRDQLYAKDEAERLLEDLYAIHQEASDSIKAIRFITKQE